MLRYDIYQDGETPLGRLLFVGTGYINYLLGDDYLAGMAHFVEEHDGAEGAAQKISRLSLEQVLKAIE